MILLNGEPVSVLVFLLLVSSSVGLALLAAVAGTGGGSLFLPLFSLPLTDVHRAVPLSKTAVLGTGLGACFVNYYRARHAKDLINYRLVTLIQPATLLGCLVGVLLNLWFPSALISLSMLAILTYTAYKTFQAANAMDNSTPNATAPPSPQPPHTTTTTTTTIAPTNSNTATNNTTATHTGFAASILNLARRNVGNPTALPFMDTARLVMSSTTIPDDYRLWASTPLHSGRDGGGGDGLFGPPAASPHRKQHSSQQFNHKAQYPHHAMPAKQDATSGDEGIKIYELMNNEVVSNEMTNNEKMIKEKIDNEKTGGGIFVARTRNEVHIQVPSTDVSETNSPLIPKEDCEMAESDFVEPEGFLAAEVAALGLVWVVNLVCLASAGSAAALVCGSAKQMAWLWADVVFIIGFMFSTYFRLRGLQAQGSPHLRWLSPRNACLYSFLAFVAGVGAALLGIGGGLVKSPMLIAIGLKPISAVATSNYMIVFTSSTNVLSYFLAGRLSLRESIFFTPLTFVGGVGGVLWLRNRFAAMGAQSTLTRILGYTIILGGTAMLVSTGINRFVKHASDERTFADACAALNPPAA